MLLAAGGNPRIPEGDLALFTIVGAVSGLIPLAFGIGAALKLRSNPEVVSRPWVVGVIGVLGGLLTGVVTFLGRGICGWPFAFVLVLVIIAVTATAPKPNYYDATAEEDKDDRRPRRGGRKLRYDEIRDADEEREARRRHRHSDDY